MSNFQRYRPDSMPPVVKNLIIINVVVFVAQQIFRQNNLTELLALYPVGYGFQPYQIATHMFTHSPGEIFHILFNMLVLWMFGRVLENVWGPKRFLLFYFICGVGAAVVHLLVQYITGDLNSAIGASGAIMGLMAAFAYLFPNTELYIMFLPIPVKAKWAVIGYVAIDLFSGLSGRGDNVAHFAHLGGALTGFIMVLIWNRTNKRRFY
jgi:membrane associated rhomboid family serine protease